LPTFRWLIENGIRFYGPMPEPPHRKPRMHNVLPNSRAFPYHLGRRARAVGVEIRLGARAERLILEQGRVTAVAAIGKQGTAILRARRGVVLAAGDFTAGTELKARFMGEREAKVEAVKKDLYRAAIDLGGTVTGEHGIGSSRREWLEIQKGADAVRVMRAIKAALDPLGILNPGRVI